MYNGVRRRKAGIYCNGKLIHNCYIIRRVVEFDYSKIKDNDVLEFVTVSNNSINPCVKGEFITRAKERYEATIEYHEKRKANKSNNSKYRKNKMISCVNCGKRFRVPRRSKRKYCSKKCKNQFDMYIEHMYKSDYMKRLKDKINYNPKKEYMEWQDDRCTDNKGHSINIGNFKDYNVKAKKRKSESWEDYHKRLKNIKRNLK